MSKKHFYVQYEALTIIYYVNDYPGFKEQYENEDVLKAQIEKLKDLGYEETK